MTKKRTDILDALIRLVLGITFIAASVHKIMDPAGFAKIIYGYAVFPDFTINLIAIIIPFVEVTAGFSIILGIYKRSATLLINILLSGFIIIIGYNLIRGHQFDCGCFSFSGTNPPSSAVSLLIRDILLLLLGIFSYYRQVVAQRYIFKTL